MRYYLNAKEMYGEIKRDLAEMGILVKPKTMQDKLIEGNPDYETKELSNYSYMLIYPSSKEIAKDLKVTLPWADEEFIERIDLSGTVNPGQAYKARGEVWEEFLHDGKFSYTYNERLMGDNQIWKIIKAIEKDPSSRQLWLSIWDVTKDLDNIGGISRVPCSLGYNFQVREGKLNMHYVMRSSDFATHFVNDVYLAVRLLEYVSYYTKYPVGTFTHTIFSLHVYNKDIKGVF